MSVRTVVLTWWIAAIAALADAQTLDLRASVGPTLVDAGWSAALDVSLAPVPALAVVGGVERSQLAFRTQRDERGGVTTFRGGSLTVGTIGLRLQWPRPTRVRPYLLAGYGAGKSRPTVNPTFPTTVTNNVRAVYAGGGIAVALGARLHATVDARMLVGDEGDELLVLSPLRVGLAWRF